MQASDSSGGRSPTGWAASEGDCWGHLDPVWLPLSGVNSNGTFMDSGKVIHPCSSEFDCSYNGLCSVNSQAICLALTQLREKIHKNKTKFHAFVPRLAALDAVIAPNPASLLGSRGLHRPEHRARADGAFNNPVNSRGSGRQRRSKPRFGS